MADLPVVHVSDTAYFVAHHRAVESARPDALFHDPLAARLAGESGRAFASQAPGAAVGEWTVAIRTVVIDAYVREAVAAGADTVLNLGAGLDARPYRLELPAGLRWVEVDYPQVQAYKEAQLAGEAPRCRVERVSLDLADAPARRALLARVDAAAARCLVLTEGVVPYLSLEEAAALADELRALPHVAGWVVDYLAPEVVRHRQASTSPLAQGAQFRFAPPDWRAFFAEHGWRPRELRYLADEGQARRRPPPLPAQVAQSEGFRRSMGYALLEPGSPGA